MTHPLSHSPEVNDPVSSYWLSLTVQREAGIKSVQALSLIDGGCHIVHQLLSLSVSQKHVRDEGRQRERGGQREVGRKGIGREREDEVGR